LVCEPALRERLGQAGARRAPEYDWSHVTAQLVELYEEVIRKRGVR
jgi:glycosyltransferase involved in cell wall biosynthesis